MPQKLPLRRAHLISPLGVGSIIEFPRDESLMTAGLDTWPLAREACPPEWKIVEERLQARLGVSHFRLPPDYREPMFGVRHALQKIPCVRFPRWHYCPRCGYMEKLPLFSERRRCPGPLYAKGSSCQNDRWKKFLVPSRFVCVCEAGHIEDFPFAEWVHKGPASDSCRLRFDTANSASSVFGMKISCSCGAERNLAGILTNPQVLQSVKSCSGARPWLGESEGADGCGYDLHVVEKGASNLYFSQIYSALYLPQWKDSVDRRIVEVLENNWAFLEKRRQGKGFRREAIEDLAELKAVDAAKLLAAAEERLRETQNSGQILTDEAFRRAEYDAILSESGGDNQDFSVSKITAHLYQSPVKDFFESIVLVNKLRETRVLAGFSRWFPEDGRDLATHKRDLALDARLDWLPATVVRGEGVFFHFDSARLDEWCRRAPVQKRVTPLLAKFAQAREARRLPPRALHARFVMLHTFAHLIINQFSYECGYGASSLRERIYCNVENPAQPMNGVLIYTAAGDCEGSMGGLVRAGRPGHLETIVQSALLGAQWCSSDPVCVQSAGQGPDGCNLAACHCCALLAETSCEEGNRLLDRALVVGTPEAPNIGFFGMPLAAI
jgi:hypothetical protein